MITHTLQDPEQYKSNNEVAKNALKKRLEDHSTPGPGEYDPQKVPPIGQTSSQYGIDNFDEVRKIKDKGLLSKLGLNENLIGKKGTAFNSTSPRFKNEASRNGHNRSRTLNGDDANKPVYDL